MKILGTVCSAAGHKKCNIFKPFNTRLILNRLLVGRGSHMLSMPEYGGFLTYIKMSLNRYSYRFIYK
jgi:hypothetical protein